MDLGKDWFENDVKPYERFTNAHENSIEAVVFNPANNIEIASGSHDKSIKLWDIQKFKQTTKLTGHTAGVWALAFSMDGKVLLSGSPDKTILVWDPKKAKPLAQLKDHPTKIYWLKASDDGKQFLSGGEDGRVMVWDMRKMQLAKTIQASSKIVYNTNFLPGNKFIIASDSLGQLKIFDTNTYQLQAQTTLRKGEKAYCVDSLQNLVDGQIKIVAGYSNKIARQWSFNPEKPHLSLDWEQIVHMDHVTSITCSKGVYATGCRDGSARLWSTHGVGTDKGIPIANLLGHTQKITQISFQPQGAQNQLQRILATGSWDQSIGLYKI